MRFINALFCFGLVAFCFATQVVVASKQEVKCLDIEDIKKLVGEPLPQELMNIVIKTLKKGVEISSSGFYFKDLSYKTFYHSLIYNPKFFECAPKLLLLESLHIFVLFLTLEKMYFKHTLHPTLKALGNKGREQLYNKLNNVRSCLGESHVFDELEDFSENKNDEVKSVNIRIGEETQNVTAQNVLEMLKNKKFVETLNSLDPLKDELLLINLRELIYDVRKMHSFQDIFCKSLTVQCIPMIAFCIERNSDPISFPTEVPMCQSYFFSKDKETLGKILNFIEKYNFNEEIKNNMRLFLLNHDVDAEDNIYQNRSFFIDNPKLLLSKDLNSTYLVYTLFHMKAMNELNTVIAKLNRSQREELCDNLDYYNFTTAFNEAEEKNPENTRENLKEAIQAVPLQQEAEILLSDSNNNDSQIIEGDEDNNDKTTQDKEFNNNVLGGWYHPLDVCCSSILSCLRNISPLLTAAAFVLAGSHAEKFNPSSHQVSKRDFSKAVLYSALGCGVLFFEEKFLSENRHFAWYSSLWTGTLGFWGGYYGSEYFRMQKNKQQSHVIEKKCEKVLVNKWKY